MLTEEAKEARRAYKRQWARDHKDAVKASQEKYWCRKAEIMKKAEAGSAEDKTK